MLFIYLTLETEMKKTQKPLRHLRDEIYDADLDVEHKTKLKAEYDMFFATIKHEDRVELNRFLIASP